MYFVVPVFARAGLAEPVADIRYAILVTDNRRRAAEYVHHLETGSYERVPGDARIPAAVGTMPLRWVLIERQEGKPAKSIMWLHARSFMLADYPFVGGIRVSPDLAYPEGLLNA